METMLLCEPSLGPVLASLCLLMWLVTILNEVTSCLCVTAAAIQLQGASTRIVKGNINSISSVRVVCFVSIQMIRLAIAILLAYGGMRFLGNTFSLGDLILNTLALEFVIQIDEGKNLFEHVCVRVRVRARACMRRCINAHVTAVQSMKAYSLPLSRTS